MLTVIEDYKTAVKKLKDAYQIEDEEKRSKKVSAAKRNLGEIILPITIEEDMLQRMKEEKEYLGAYITAHPLSEYPDFEEIGATPISSLSDTDATIFGIIDSIDIKKRKKDGKEMAFVTLDDGSGTITVNFFTKQYEIYKDFLEEGNVPIGSSKSAIQSPRGGTNSDLYIWEPNSNTHSPTGITNAYSLFGQTIGANNAPLSYSGVSREISESQNITLGNATAAKYPTYFSNVNANYKTETGFNTNRQIFDFKAGITKIRVYIWLEGQDVDCENGSSSGDLEFKFQFTTNPS